MSNAVQLSPLIDFKVEILKGPHAGELFSFENKKNVFIGRGSENEISLSKDPHISRQHAEIKQLDGHFYVANLSHKNFILVNGDRVDTDRIENKAILKVGDSELRVTIVTAASKSIGESTIAIHQPSGHLPLVAPIAPPVQVVPAPTAKPLAKPPLSAPPLTPAPKMQSAPRPRIQGPPAESGSRTRFYIIVAIVGFAFVWLVSSNKSKKVAPGFRGSVEVQGDLNESQKSIDKMTEKIDRMKDPAILRSQENYIRGFREFRQGNYARAIDHFQIVLSLDPSNTLAEHYKKLAIIKHDELVKFNMIQGRKYREKRNFRLCKSSFKNALVLIQYNKQHPDFPEADRFFEECDKALQGRM